MKILIIAHKMPYPPRGGATLRNFNLMKECSKNNEIHLLTFTQEPYLRDPEKLRESIEYLKKYCSEVKVFKIPSDYNRLYWYLLLFLNLLSIDPYSVWKFWSPAMTKAIKKHMKNHDFDLIEIGCISLIKYARLAPGLPRLMIHHNLESQLLFRRSKISRNWLAKIYLALQAYKLRRLEKIACRTFDYHTTVSELDKKVLLEISSNINVAVVDNGTDTDYFKPMNVSLEEDTLVFAGSMSWYPNADAMIFFVKEIWPLIKKKIPDIKLNLIGSQPPAELIELCQIEPGVNLLGFVEDVRTYIAKSSVYVVPIRVGGGTRLKILDAMAMGKAIISSSIGCEGIEVRDGENIVIADDPEKFAEKIIQLLRNKSLRNRLEIAARETAVKYYSWSHIAPKLEAIYSQLATLSKDRREDGLKKK
jgi:sugar transferase (PEP-CTERM/EpsH1 system associated)